MQGKWYLSIAAVREYMQIHGWDGEMEEDNPNFTRTQKELAEMSETARLVEGAKTNGSFQLYRAKMMFRGSSVRVELTVNPNGRSEGSLPQLIRVRLKDQYHRH